MQGKNIEIKISIKVKKVTVEDICISSLLLLKYYDNSHSTRAAIENCNISLYSWNLLYYLPRIYQKGDS